MERPDKEASSGCMNAAPTEGRVSARAVGKPLYHYWEWCVGAGRANEGLRASWQEQLAIAVCACGFRYIRFHGLFHDDMFVYQRVEGEQRYNWMYIDDVFDRLLDIGVRPFVELGFFPPDMVEDGREGKGSTNPFWWGAHVVPPEDFGEWSELVGRTVEHWIGRYGLHEVRQWYFEVWNEPNLAVFWGGSQQQYFELYRETVRVLKRIDAQLRVGGPATSNFVPRRSSVRRNGGEVGHYTELELRAESVEWESVWLEQFLQFCQREGLPLDFISTHPYPTDIAIDLKGEREVFSRNIDATTRDLGEVRRIVDGSAYPEAEIHLTEWSSSPSSRDFAHDYLPAATFVVKANIEAAGLVDSLSYWTFTDIFEESGAGSRVFHGGFGLMNFQGIVKPTFHAYRFLHMLGDEEIGRGEGYIITRDTRSGYVSMLLYHYPDEVRTVVPTAKRWEEAQAVQRRGTTREVLVEIRDLVPGTEFLIETLDEEHGCATTVWEEMGRPEDLTREQASALRMCGWNTKKEVVVVDERGVLCRRLCLRPWSLVSIRVKHS